MAMFGSDLDRPLYDRGPSPGLRFTIYAIVAIVLMYYDRHGELVQRIRYALSAVTYPIQEAVGSPRLAWDWLSRDLQTRDGLQLQNRQLQAQVRDLELKTMRQEALSQENAQLRGLRASLPPLIKHWQLAQIISVETDPLRQRVVIDKGAHDGVVANQAVVDGSGILGQVARVGPWSAEVILVTDPEHAIPVQVTRNSLRTVAVGGGSDGELLLPYLASNADVRTGDLLVSSGLGGVFPAGFPVARVTGVRADGSQQVGQIRARPVADVTRDREVILLQFDAANPAAPAPNPPIAPAPAPKPAAATTKAQEPTDE
jgi:rod shape-determining protein MreC